MTRRHRTRRDLTGRSIAAIGAAALFAAAVVGYFSFQAIHGLPFAPSYRLSVSVPNANRLVSTDDVRIGGVRVGQVTGVSAVPDPLGGHPFARLALKLNGSVGRLPVDTRVRVRSSSVLGSTYVELTPGSASKTVEDGGRLPLRASASTVQLTDLLNMFDRATRRGVQGALGGLGAGFAGRGASVNTSMGALASFVPSLEATTDNLADPRTRLDRFVPAIDRFSAALAPVAPQMTAGLRDGGATLLAIVSRRAALGEAIRALPVTEHVTATALRSLTPQLRGLARLARTLRPAGKRLPGTLDQVNLAAAGGTTSLRGIPPIVAPLVRTLGTVRDVASRPSTNGALRKLGDAVTALDELLTVLTPAQVTCNISSLFGINFSQAGRPGVGVGPALPDIALSTLGAQAEELQHAAPSSNVKINYLPHENASECESGNEPISSGQSLTNPPGLQSNQTRKTVPPPGVRALAVKAGLIGPPKGHR